LQERETIQSYLETVREQIRWKRARPVLVQELERHLEDQRDAFVQAGNSSEEAERLAVADMGDPVTVGAELDRIHRPKPQWGLLGLTLALACTGAILRVSLTSGWEFDSIGLPRTVLALALGSACLLGMYVLDISRLARHAGKLYIAALVLIVSSWYWSPTTASVPYYTRYLLLACPVLYVFCLYSLRQKGWIGFLLAIFGGLVLTMICIQTPYLQAAMMTMLTGFVLLLCAIQMDWFGISRKKARLAAFGAALAAAAGYAYILSIPSVWTRLQIAIHPELDPLCRGYHGLQIRKVLESARWLGMGTLDTGGHGLERFLPEAGKDMLPTTMVYTLGWLPYLLLLAALVALLVWLLVRGIKQKHQLGRLIVVAVSLTLGFQLLFSVILNSGMVLFGAHLPLVVGNLHTVMDMALTGLALSVFRGSSIARETQAAPGRRIKRIRLQIEYQ
jgi:rod shape determining protein RodA